MTMTRLPRELLWPVIFKTGQADALDEPVGDLVALCFGNPALVQAERDILAHGQPGEQGV
jgi:hypothetical protein